MFFRWLAARRAGAGHRTVTETASGDPTDPAHQTHQSHQTAAWAQATLWARTRRPARDSDDALSGTARHWLRQLPGRRRPLRLCAVHPRVANRIAWHWADRGGVARVIDELLVDRRGGRRGFEPAVVRELQRLAEHNAQRSLAPRVGPSPLGPASGRVAAR